jgi:aryl-alcohol dehydrogenase-like predicted oxidoreductase
VRRAVDLGINSIDTADIYTGGRSEEIIGNAVHGYRDDVVIATKVGIQGGASGRNIVAKVNQSLQRLRTDHIDLYYIHVFDDATPLKETMAALDSLVREGKVRYVACSNFNAAQMEAARRVSEENGYASFIADQPDYSLLQRGAEADVIPYCRGHRMGVLAYSPLRGGLLVGKYTRGGAAPQGSRGAYNRQYLDAIQPETYDKVEKLRAVAREEGVSLMELSVGWLLAKDAVTSVIVGASRTDQLQETAAIADLRLSDEAVRRADDLTAPGSSD